MTTFDDLYNKHAAFVHKRLYVLTQQHELAEDLCQETFIRAWKAMPRLKHDGNLGAWLWTIATNVTRDYQRHKRLSQQSYEAMRDGIDGAWDIEDTSQPDLAAYFAEADMRRAAFARLQPAQQRHLCCIATDPDHANRMEVSRARGAYHKAYAVIAQEVQA